MPKKLHRSLFLFSRYGSAGCAMIYPRSVYELLTLAGLTVEAGSDPEQRREEFYPARKHVWQS